MSELQNGISPTGRVPLRMISSCWFIRTCVVHQSTPETSLRESNEMAQGQGCNG